MATAPRSAYGTSTPIALTSVAKTIGAGVHTAVVDVTDATAVDAATAAVEREFGRIDILVNSAGITGPNDTIWNYDVDAWRQVIDIDLTGTFLTCRAAAPYMRARDYGRIVNIASIAGKEGNPNASAYSAAKAGVIGLTKSLGKELAGTGVTANCVTPAAVKTEIFDQMTEEHINFMLSKIPLGRFGLVEEVAGLVTFVFAECSFSTGAALTCPADAPPIENPAIRPDEAALLFVNEAFYLARWDA